MAFSPRSVKADAAGGGLRRRRQGGRRAEAILELRPSGARSQAVAKDVSAAYRSAVAIHLPEGVIVFDHFHLTYSSDATSVHVCAAPPPDMAIAELRGPRAGVHDAIASGAGAGGRYLSELCGRAV